MVAQAFDLYYLLVENVFGNIFLAALGIMAMMVVIGIISRMSSVSIIFTAGTFILVFAVGYVGALAAVPIFIIAIFYFLRGGLNLIKSLS